MIAFSRTISRNLLLAGLAITGTIASFTATTAPAQAAARGGAFVASLAAPLAQPRHEILDGVLWRCEGDRCLATADAPRPVMTCGRVAKKFGEVVHFATPAGALSNEDLARCNAMK